MAEDPGVPQQAAVPQVDLSALEDAIADVAARVGTLEESEAVRALDRQLGELRALVDKQAEAVAVLSATVEEQQRLIDATMSHIGRAIGQPVRTPWRDAVAAAG